MDSNAIRGSTTYKARAKQPRDFTGLRYGNITPTDVDALIEYKDKCYIFIEAKTTGVNMPFGQKMALERLCDDLSKVKPTLLIVINHNTPPDKEINFANSVVERYRHNNVWKIPKKTPTTRQLIDSFLATVNNAQAY